MAEVETAQKHLQHVTYKATLSKTTILQEFFKLIKVGVVNSNLMTTFTGLWLALYYNGQSFLDHLGLIFLTMSGSAFIISGSLVLNNYIDRDIDYLMDRTKSRPTVTGRMNPFSVLLMGGLFVIIGTSALAFTSFLAALFGVIGFISYVFLYSLWTKRQYTINTVIGSISGAVPPLIGWTAINPDLPLTAWILFFIVFIWQTPHVFAIAMKRCDDYKRASIPMYPVVYGFDMAKRQMMIWIACLLPLPFYLYFLGLPFIILATILNIGWLYLGFKGFKNKNYFKWANQMFLYSVNYLTILFVAMVVMTIF